MTSAIVIVIIAIVAAIALGAILKVNFGFIGMGFAFICCLILGINPGQLVPLWPAKLFFQMFSITFFYAFALNNGTMELLAKKLVRGVRNMAFLVPIMMWIIGCVLSGIGPGSIAIFLILMPIYMQIARRMNIPPILMFITLSTGANSGAWSPIAVNGITTIGLIEAAGYNAQQAMMYGMIVWRNMAVASLVVFIIAYIIFKGWKGTVSTTEDSEKFNPKQRTTVTLIIILTLLLVVPPFLSAILHNGAFSAFASNLDPIFLAIIFAVIAAILKVDSEKKALAGVPWNTILMVTGMALLVGVAAQAGAMKALSNYIGHSFSAAVVPYILCIVGGLMASFSSTMGVVVPTLYPLIFAIAGATGAMPALLFSVVPIAGVYMGMSPFSLSGAIALASFEEVAKDAEAERNKLFILLIIAAIVSIFLTMAMVAVGLIRN